jgi:hypothetical protein
MTEVSFTDKDIEAYDASVLERQNRMAAFASRFAVHYTWHPEKLNADGSLADADSEKAKQAWSGTKRTPASSTGTGKQGTW